MKPDVVIVHIETREDFHFASSPDVPGLFLCGKDIDALKADIAPLIELLRRLND